MQTELFKAFTRGIVASFPSPMAWEQVSEGDIQ